MGRGGERRGRRGRGRQSNDKKDPREQTEQRELPFHVINEMIFTRLPIKSIVRFKSVCKLLYSTLSSPRFAFVHFKFPRPLTTQSLFIRSNNKFQILSYENGDQSTQIDNTYVIDWVNEKVDFEVGNEKIVLVGTCNGLVCLGSESGCLFIIWNPITREFYKFTSEDCRVTWGFGYVSSVDDYKIVRICKKVFTRSFRVHVYSRRLDRLRRIENNDASHNLSGLRVAELLDRPGLLFNETLYWMCGVYEFRRKIISFDLASEMLDMFPHMEVGTPWPYAQNVTSYDECLDLLLGVVNGCLYKYGISVISGEGVLALLKGPGETKEIIFPRILVGSEFYDNLIGFTGTNNVFIQYCSGYNAPGLGAIGIRTSQVLKHTRLMILETSTKSEVVSYCASLLSPYVLTILIDGDSNL